MYRAARGFIRVNHVIRGGRGYSPFGTALQQLDDARKKLERIVKLAEKYHVLPCIHCHSGRMVANGGVTVYLLLKDFRPDQAGAYVDPMHMTVEGGLAGWEIGLDLLGPWVSLVGVKNFRWKETGKDATGRPTFSVDYVPVAEGQADLPAFMGYLEQLKYDGVVSVHAEYRGKTERELLTLATEDLAYLRKLV